MNTSVLPEGTLWYYGVDSSLLDLLEVLKTFTCSEDQLQTAGCSCLLICISGPKVKNIS